MAKKIIYVHSGDTVEVRVIADPELPLLKAEWAYQIRPRAHSLSFPSQDVLHVNSDSLSVYGGVWCGRWESRVEQQTNPNTL
jgi:hypothetical protein